MDPFESLVTATDAFLEKMYLNIYNVCDPPTPI